MDKVTVTVMKDRYPTHFNIPKPSRHIIKHAMFIPTHRFSTHIEGVTFIRPNTSDLIHTVNRIPIATTKPFLITFESHLPRYFGGEQTKLFAYMRRRLAEHGCRKIIALSECAKAAFLATHKGTDEYDSLAQKLTVIYPNIVLPALENVPPERTPPLTLVFVGAHFGRKGGAVAARAAQIARERRLPLHFHIISSLQVGASVWSDPKNPTFFDEYINLLNGANITFDNSLPNRTVLAILSRADFSFLPTLSDTFGYSVIESLSFGTPAIVTTQGALTEFMVDRKNGVVIPLQVDRYGEWIYVGRSDKDSRRFEAIYRDEIERIARAVVDAVAPYCDEPRALESMRHNARATAEQFFDSRKTGPLLDRIYDESVS